MERITMSIDETLARQFDAMIAKRGYASRSEAMRDLLRREVEAQRVEGKPRTQCVASLSYVFNHHQRDLTERLTAAQHDNHDLVVATMHVHLDHENCLESTILKGSTSAVRAFADAIRAQRGVAHGHVNLITVEPGDRHRHSRAQHHRGHTHLVPGS